MKLLVNNFSGNMPCGTKYRIVHDVDSESIKLMLMYFHNGIGKYTMVELLNKMYKPCNFDEKRRELLIQAELEWGIELLEPEIQNKISA